MQSNTNYAASEIKPGDIDLLKQPMFP